jgi:hypothetical protein
MYSEILKHFGMESCKPMYMPLGANSKLHITIAPKTSHEIQEMKDVPCTELVGNLMYAMVATKLNFLNAMNIVRQFMLDPFKEH